MYIPSIDYSINRNSKNSCCMSPSKNMIKVALPFNHGLNDDELIKHMADTLTHEFLHHVLDYTFPREISFLFDAIGEKLSDYPELLKRTLTFDGATGRLWSETIKKYGIDGLIALYGLDRDIIDKLLKEGV